MLGIAALGIFGATYANAFEQNGYKIPKEKLNQTPPVAFEERTPPQWKGGKTDVISLFERGGLRIDPNAQISIADDDDDEKDSDN
jgi:hypothetical protein